MVTNDKCIIKVVFFFRLRQCCLQFLLLVLCRPSSRHQGFVTISSMYHNTLYSMLLCLQCVLSDLFFMVLSGNKRPMPIAKKDTQFYFYMCRSPDRNLGRSGICLGQIGILFWPKFNLGQIRIPIWLGRFRICLGQMGIFN